MARLPRRSLAVFSVFVLLMLVAVGCSPEPAAEPVSPPAESPDPPAAEEPVPSEPSEPTEPSAIAWLDTELVDVQTGETFRISDFKGRPVLVKAFAVW